jgi:hypothetical protein
MENSVIGWRGGRLPNVAIAVFVLATMPLAFGTNSNCPSATGTNLTTINSEASGMTSSTISTTGCGAVDETFGNFIISGFTGVSTAPTLSNTNGWATASNFAQDLNSDMAASLPTSGFTLTTSTGDLVFLTQFGTGASPTVNASLAGIVLTLTGVDLPDNNSGATNDSSIAVTIGICENATSAPSATFADCTALGGTYASSTATITNTSGSTNISGATETFVLALPSTIMDLAVDDTVVLTSNRVGPTSFSGFEEEFDAPEPSTFVLLGAALAVVGLLRLRPRRRFNR